MLSIADIQHGVLDGTPDGESLARVEEEIVEFKMRMSTTTSEQFKQAMRVPLRALKERRRLLLHRLLGLG